MFDVPILIIAFNRPKETEILINEILKIKPRIIYFAVNCPRESVIEDIEKVSQVKSLNSRFSDYTQVKLLYSKKNSGARAGILSAIDWLFDNEDFGIIFEDDCIPDLSFFTYAQELLELYKNNQHIGMISGDNFSFNRLKIKNSYYFSKYFHIWGWATWRRAWKSYIRELPDTKEMQNVLNTLKMDVSEKEFWMKSIVAAYQGKIDTWDLQWLYSNWFHNRIAVMPSVNLIKNIGFGEGATNTKDRNSPFGKMQVETLKFPLKHPKKIKINEYADYFSMRTFHNPPIYLKLKHRLFRILQNFIGNFNA